MQALDAELPLSLGEADPAEDVFVFPVSFAQWRLWFLDQLQPGSPAYNIAASVRLSGDLDASALTRALEEVVRRHEALRTAFALEDGQPVQRVVSRREVELPVIDLERYSDLADPADTAAVARRLTDEEARKPFDLARGPLMRATLLRLEEGEHQLILVLHHTIADGWSMGVLVREAAALYGAFAAGLPSPLPELPIQYADYTIWQREHLQGEALESRLAWWREHLRGAPAVLDLPADHPRAPHDAPRGGLFEARLPAGLSDAARDLARQEKTTLFTVLLAAFQLLLSRLSNQEDLVVVTPVANRHPVETETLIGFFVNTLALRGDLSGDPSFRELLGRTAESTAGAFARQDTPFEPVVEALAPDRGVSLRPLFQAMLALQNAPMPPLELPGLTLEMTELDNGAAAFDVVLEVKETAGGFTLRWGYDVELYEPETVRRWHGAFQILLDGIVADPARRLSQFPWLGADERRQLLDEWSGTAVPFRTDLCLHELIAEQAERTPDAAAVVVAGVAGRPEESLTFAELSRRAAQLAGHLRRLGVGPEVTVALCTERSADQAVGVLGILQSGGAYVPLDPAYPAERLAFMLEDSAAPVVVAHRGLAERLPLGGRHIVELGLIRSAQDDGRGASVGEPVSRSGERVHPENPAYVIYTSGSTGRPKGVVVPHRAVVHHAQAWSRLCGLTERDRVLQFASLSFDAAAEEMFPTWASGGCVVFFPEASTSGPAELMELVRREELTVLDLPAPFWHEWVAEVQRPGSAPLAESLRLVISGSEAASAARLAAWRQALGEKAERAVWLNSYGPTETTITATTWLPPASGEVPGLGTVPIGRPLPNFTAYVVDRRGEPVPAGVPGELWIGGAGVTRGYLRRPDLTADRFAPDPYGKETGSRVYRTGDLVRWLAPGDIEFLGRIDRQVKVRGYRIELGEVEEALLALPQIREAAVVAREDRGTKRLAAYAVLEDPEADPRVLRDALRQRLPEPMVPSAVVILPALPRMPNGKVDRRALERGAEPEWGGMEDSGGAAPQTPTEEILAGLFAEVLGRPAVGRHDSFFNLGGHSLLATQVVARLREVLRIELPLRRLFEAPTVADLALRVDAARQAAPAPAPPVRAAREDDTPAPLSFAQQRLWLVDQLDPGSPLYNVPSALQVTGALDEAALAAALTAVVERHEALRTSFPAARGVAAQVVHPSRPVPLPAVDLTGLAPAMREAEAARLADEDAARPFDLERGPLLRGLILRLGSEDRRLLFNLHHIVSDGWSIGVLLRELGVLYEAAREGQPSPLPELPIQYSDYARWQRGWLQGEVLEEQLGYWRERLAGAPPVLELPSDRPRPAVLSPRGATRSVALPSEVTPVLADLGRREGATLFMTLLAGFSALLGRYTGRDDLTVGTAVAGRRWPQAEGLIGLFVNTLALRQDLSGGPSFRELLGRVRDTVLDAHAHQDLPFERLVEALNPERSLAHTPVFQVMFVLQNAPLAPLVLPGLDVRLLEADAGTSRFDLTLSLEEKAGVLAGVVEYSTELFDATTVDRLVGHLGRLLAAGSANPEAPASELPLLSAAEKRHVLVEWAEAADAAVKPQGALLLHQLVEAQAARTPDAIAVESEHGAWTYRELDERAGRIASHIRAAGLGPEDVVALLADRTLARVAAMVGILKSGAAWVPLDHTQPAERLAMMAGDSKACLLVVEPAQAQRFPDFGLPVLDLEQLVEAGVAEDRPRREPAPDNLAYVLYTSGSTGRPKGAMITHRSVCNMLMREQLALPLGPADAVLHSGSIAFDVSVLECLAPLVAGARLVLATPEGHRDPSGLVRLSSERQVTRVYSVPSALEAMLREDVERCTALRDVFSAGEALPPGLLRRCYERLNVMVMNAYGPTEATIYITRWPGEIRAAYSQRVPVGRPVAGARVYIVDKAGQPAPAGVPGELRIGGTCLARGYAGRPDVTAEKFVPNPFAAGSDDAGGAGGERLYCTGDLTRWLPDGQIDLLGRLDHQVKVRGIRVELGEVEAVLARAPGVVECAAGVRDTGLLYAYLSGGAGGVDTAALRVWLRGHLPEVMVPSELVCLEGLPHLPSGKVDRKALAAMAPLASTGVEHVPPRTPEEEILAGIWAEVLGERRIGGASGRIGVYDDFFALGGHSLLATQVLSRVRESFGVEIPVSALFTEPTVAGIAELVRQGLAVLAPDTDAAPPLVPVPDRGDRHPLSFAQARLWLLESLEPGSPVYNIPSTALLTGLLDPARFQATLTGIVERHEALRTVFLPEQGRDIEAVAVVVPARQVDLPLVDLAALPVERREAESRYWLQEEGSRAFDLRTGPLLRALLVRIGEGEHHLLLNVHHMVADGWSMSVLLREVAALYEGRGLPALPVQYGDYAVWQRGWLQGEVLESRLAWWRSRLEGVPPVLELPSDRPRPAARTPHGGIRVFRLPAAVADNLESLAQSQGATLFMVLLAGLEALLHRVSGQPDLAVGSAIAGRNRLETEPLIGFFVNTLVLRSDLREDPDPPFLDHLAQVRESALGAHAHQDLPFERLVEELRPERSLSHTPLFQVFFLLQNTPESDLAFAGLELHPLGIIPGTAKFDLTVSMGRFDGDLHGSIEYSSDLYEAATVERMAGHLTRLLTALGDGAAAPTARLSELPLLSAPERAELLWEWSDTASGHRSDLTLHRLFERQAAAHPGDVAAVCPRLEGDSDRLTYGELDRQANRLARHLRSLGVAPETRVGLCTERSLDMVVGMLGILKAGGAYVPLDPAYPAERLGHMLEDSAATVLVTHRSLDRDLPLAGVSRVVRLDDDIEEIARQDGGVLEGGAGPENLAYTIFTSGSTGRPKGVQIEHRDVIHRAETSRRLFVAGRWDVWTLFHSYGFDISVWEMWTCYVHGGRLVVVPRFLLEDPVAFHDVLAEEGVTILNQTPVTLRRLAQAWDERRTGPEELSLRRVFCGGEAFPVEVGRRLLEAGVSAWNLYGPTEVTVWGTAHEVTREDLERGGVPIGRPLADARIRLLDPAFQPVPAGVAGELCVAGADLARGYAGRPELTAGRFVPDPFAERPGDRLYRTGDLARFRADGSLEYLGRIDHQVKVRGHRVELLEIEEVLSAHPAVRQAAALVRKDLPGGEGLVAYVVPREGATADTVVLRTWLQGRLPDFMVPTAWVVLPALPVTANGKVDRRALPSPHIDAAGAGIPESIAPRDPMEETLAALWAGALGLPAVGIHDDFFARGGHSLLATQVLSRVRRAFHVEMPLRALFEEPTVAGFAARLRAELQREGRTVAAPPLKPAVGLDRGRMPLSFAQQRLWFLEQLEPGTAFYNIPAVQRVHGPLLLPVLERALTELVRRHESLRTVFRDEAGEPFQVILPDLASAHVIPPLIDLTALPEKRREPEVRRLATADSRRPFDLEHGPLMRVTLVRVAPEDHTAFFNLHHIISDGWSMQVLTGELAALYGAIAAGLPSPLAPLPLQYADYAVWQREWMAGEVLEAQLAYWRERLEGVPGLELPADRQRPAVETFRGRNRPVALSPALSAGLQALALREGATPFIVLLAAFATALYRYTGQTDVPVGTPIANRTRPEVEGVIGFFANTLVMRADLSGPPVFRDLVEQVRGVALGAYANQEIPFERLVEELQPERDMSRNPLFQVMMAFQNHPRPAIDLGGMTFVSENVDAGIAKFDLTLFWWDEEGRLEGVLEYNTDLYDDTTALRFFRHLEALLAGVVADPGRPLLAYELLSEAERHQIAAEWNDTAEGTEEDLLPVHLWVERQAAMAPDEVAAVYEGNRLTYRELDERANRLAHALRRRGVGPEALVGICVERSLPMLVAMLGVLKAGGAGVALDPAYPVDRLAAIVRDAGLEVLLTQESLAGRFPEHGHIAILLDPAADPTAVGLFPEESPERLQSGVTLDHPMYAIYTSGSTGQPKGIVVTHRAFANLLRWQLRRSGLSPRARTVQFATFGFCVSFQEIFSAWSTGASLVLAGEMTRRDVANLGDFLAAGQVERLHLPFAALKHLAEAAAGRPVLPPTLREVITAGEQLQVTPAVREMFERLEGCVLHNQYGASETHVVSALALTGSPCDWPGIPSVGTPISNIRIHLLDGGLEPMPVGVPGELYAGGACLARCYLNDPVLTAQKLIPDPFSGSVGGMSEAGARLYRTGDQARYLADGRIEYHGRLDGQVKIRGFRVELGEVDTTLARHPAVRDAATVALVSPGSKTGPRLAAYVVAQDDAGPGLFDELRSYLRQTLPEYMVPAAFVRMAALPLNANGKLDQAALPAPDDEDRATAYAPPRNPTEEVLAAVWGEVLGLDRVGVHDDFFVLGGHSLLATQVASRVRRAFKVDLPLRALFDNPTVADLARDVEARVHAGSGVSVPPIRRVPRAPDAPYQDFPLAFAQEWMWLADRLDASAGSTFNSPISVRFSGRLDRAALEASVREVVRRHEATRATFPLVDGRPVQRIAAVLDIHLPLVDLAGLPTSGREAAATALAEEAFRRRLDLERGPLLETLLLRTAPDEHVLLVVIHHILFDGWSGGVLLREVAALYAAFATGAPSPLPELPIQYPDFAVWQREWLQGEVMESLLGYWRERLAGDLPVLELPGARTAAGVTTLSSAVHRVELGAEVSAAVRAFARREGVTLFAPLLAAFETLLHRSTRHTDIPVGTLIANRNRPEIEGLLGYFVNTLVMRGDLSGDPGFRELVAHTRETALEAYTHQDLPFTRLVEALRPDRAASRTPLFQVLFLLQNAPMPALELPGLIMSPFEAELPLSTFDMALVLEEGPDGLTGGIWYNRDLLDSRAVADFTDRYRILLESAMSDPDRRLSELSLLTEPERQQLLAGRPVSSPAPAIPVTPAISAVKPEQLLHGRFQQRVEDDPDAAALLFAGEEITYGELNERANRLARHLRGLGVGPEVRVGLCLDRTPELIVAILAVLKAGGAYVPLDPAYPRERQAFLLADSGVRALIAEHTSAQGLPEVDVPVVWLDLWLDKERAALERLSGSDLDLNEAGAGPENAAYVIYTSGSTGQPKGVVVNHANVLRLFDETADWFRFDERDTWTLFHSYAFDFSVWEIWGALLHGGQLVVVPWEVTRSPEDFYELLRREKVTVLNQTPSAFGALAAHALQAEAPGDAGARRDAGLRNLRWVIFGGEALHLPSLKPWFERFGDRRPRLVNMYGITETTVHVTYRPIAAADLERGSVIGEPIPDLRVYVLDERLEPVPFGVPGEMYVGAAGDQAGLSRGYLGRPELTAERFVPDPFSGTAGARLYRTGDLARVLSDGELEYLGRADTQVKIRGFRIEPGEIEAALTRHPAVREAVVVAREDGDLGVGDRRLVGYVVPDPQRAQPLLRLLQLEREGKLEGKLTFEMPNAMVVFHQHAGVTLGIYREIFEGEVYRRHGMSLPPGACVFDVGANMGQFTLWAGRNAPGARIFSFEPIPATAEVLRANADLYGLDATVYAAGVADGERTETFTYYPFFSSTSGRFPDQEKDRADIKAHILNEQKVLGGEEGLFELWRAEREGALDEWLDQHMKSEKVSCRLIPLSSVIREHGVERIDLLKIDAERSELEVLAGLAEEDWPKVQQMVIEVHDAGIRDRVLEILQARGFDSVVEQDVYLEETELYNVYARRPGLPTVEPAAPEEAWSSPNRLADDLRHALAAELPEHMVPAAVVVLDSLPLTPHGKVDRKALPAPESVRASRLADRPVVEPRTPVERELVAIWKELLRADRVSIYDNFFELGGHSLLLTQLASRIRNVFQVEVPLRVLFDVRDVVEMTAAIADRQVEQMDQSEMAEMLDELKQLTPEEIQALLEAES